MSNFNKDELEPPSWVNETFFEGVLKSSEDDDTIKVIKLEITPGSGKGDHYASIMFRAKITYDSKSSKGNVISLILKTMPEEDCHKNEMFGGLPMFEVEIDMYSRIIPKLESELRKIGDKTVLGPKMVYHSLEPRKCIIFEDLAERGYKALQGRLTNIDETKAAFLKLAKWHAVSYKLAAEGDAPVTDLKGSFFNNSDFDSLPMNTSGIPNLIKTVEGVDELKIYAEKLKKIPNDFVRYFLPVLSSPEEPFIKVLCHGDFHSRNMMFKNHASGELDDVMLLDFQVSFFGPAVYDVLYALCLMVDVEIRLNHREEIIYYYATNFIDTLKKMNFKGMYPSISDFYIDISRAGPWELFLLSTFLPILYVVMDGSKEIEELIKLDTGLDSMYNNSVYVKELKIMLPKLLHMGYLEWGKEDQ